MLALPLLPTIIFILLLVEMNSYMDYFHYFSWYFSPSPFKFFTFLILYSMTFIHLSFRYEMSHLYNGLKFLKIG